MIPADRPVARAMHSGPADSGEESAAMKNVSRRETLVLVATATCVTAFATAVAPAQEVPAPVRAAVVQLEERDVFVDVGAPHARQGLELDVYRGIEVRHPLTKRVLRDRYVIGRLVIVHPGATISIARLRGTPHRPIAVGDVVETEAAVVQTPAQTPAQTPTQTPTQ